MPTCATVTSSTDQDVCDRDHSPKAKSGELNAGSYTGEVPQETEVVAMTGNKPLLRAPSPHTTILTTTEVHEAAPSKAVGDPDAENEESGIYVSAWSRWTTYYSLLIFVFMSLIWELMGRFMDIGVHVKRPGYAPLLKDFDDYWNRRFYRRISDCWNRPIDSRPSRVVGVMERTTDDYGLTFRYTGRILPCINLGSYNYLGFANDTPRITQEVLGVFDALGIATCSASQEAGHHDILPALERVVAHFVGKEDSIVCGMGFGTNFKGLPALFGKGTLCISDHLNHSSIVNGVRSSGATVHPFRHGKYNALEQILREAIILGQDPQNNVTAYKPWDRIVILVEGIYSMEGEIIDLKRVVEIKKKYHALVFVDEAHSIGAIGRSGRGVCEHCGVDPKDVDILMGTFTKSFGSIGGYIAGDKSVIDAIRCDSTLSLHYDAMPAACAQQVLSVLDVILGKDGTDLGEKRIAQLKANSTFFRQGLIQRGFQVLGDDASPVIPVMTFNMGKLPALSRKCLERGIAIVAAGYPATPLLESRIRFCVSATHTREDLQYVLGVLDDISKYIYLKYAHHTFFGQPSAIALSRRDLSKKRKED